MPLFFVISGFLLDEKKIYKKQYVLTKAKTLLLPYFCYCVLDTFFFKRDFSVLGIIKLIWGGRYITGVYWYITCYLFTIILLAVILRFFHRKYAIPLIIMGGGFAVIESQLVQYIPALKSPGVPWNLDVSLMALVYLAMGFFGKHVIAQSLDSQNRKYDIFALFSGLAVVVFCWINYRSGLALFKLDMKVVLYTNLFLSIIVPSAFGMVWIRLTHWLERWKTIFSFFCYLGRVTFPIMFLHIPMNMLKEQLDYGRFAYVFVGITLPIVFALIFGRYRLTRKLFGLPKVMRITVGEY